MDTVEVWQAIMATAGGVALAVAIPLIGFGLAFRGWIQSVIKGELADFKADITKQFTSINSRLDRLIPFEGSLREQSYFGLMDEPNPPISRKNELLEHWHDSSLTYEESLELKFILEQEAKQADANKKVLIIAALVGLGLYLLTKKE